MSAPSKRQTHPWPWWRRLVRELVWATDMDDGTGDGSPSMTKGMAASFAILTILAIWLKKPVSGTHVALAIIAISAAFGRSMWRHYLSRTTLTQATTDATTRASTVTHTITERRDGTAGVEPAP